MKIRSITSFLVLVLAVGMLLNGFAVSSHAQEPNKPSTIKYEGVTYFNVDSSHFKSGSKEFYRDLLTTKQGNWIPISEVWLRVAGSRPNVGANRADISVKDQYTMVRGASSNYPMSKYSEGSTAALNWGDWYENGKYRSRQSNLFWDYSSDDPVKGSFLEQRVEIQKNKEEEYSLIVMLYDFHVAPIMPDASVAGNYVSSSVAEKSMTDDGKIDTQLSYWNYGDTTVPEVSKQWEVVKEASLSNTVDGSRSFSFTEGFEVGHKFSAGLIENTVKFNFSATQALKEGWSETKSQKDTDKTTDRTKFDAPAQTAIILSQANNELSLTTKYNCPVAIKYKVIIEWRNEDSKYKPRKRITSFSEGIDSFKDPIVWNDMYYEAGDSRVREYLDYLRTNVPMSQQGGTIEQTLRTHTIRKGNPMPIYPLKSVELTGDRETTMHVGESGYLYKLDLQGYNENYVPYYGFKKEFGHWIVTDEKGNELNASTAPVTITNEANAQYKAVRSGTCYLKYIIDEDKYGVVSDVNYKTKNSELTSTAMFQIKVLPDDSQNGVFKITGNFVGTVGAAAEAVEGDGKLDVMVTDSSGVEYPEFDYYWQAMEKKDRGISITKDGMVTFTKAGSFHVRVVNANNEKNYSDWKTIEAEANGRLDALTPERDEIVNADGDTMFFIEGSYTGGLINAPENIEGEGKLSVVHYDGTGREIALNRVWEAQETDGITLTEDGTVSFTHLGTYHVRVRSGEYASGWHEIEANHVAPARIIIAPTANDSVYSGSPIALLTEGIAEHGTILYALGTNDTTAPNDDAYSSEIPTGTDIGTYYAWYKAEGDETHVASKPVCVIVKISSTTPEPEPEPEPKPEPKPDDDPDEPINTNFKKSNGSCDVGFSVIGLGMLLTMLIVRRKSH